MAQLRTARRTPNHQRMYRLSARSARSCSVALVTALLFAPMLQTLLGGAVTASPGVTGPLVEPVRAFAPPKVKAPARRVSTPAPIVVPQVALGQDRLDIFRGLGAWVDLYDMHLSPTATVARMHGAGVRTLYIQSGRTNTAHAVDPRIGPWLRASHAAGIKVVGWYLPFYLDMKRDLSRTVAIARYSWQGEYFDGLGIDIEFMSRRQAVSAWHRAVGEHVARVRAAVGPVYPIAAIPIPPLQMALRPARWEAFPWKEIAAKSDALMLMAYWSERRGCPQVERHCAGSWTRANVAQARRLAGRPDVLIHIIGGIGDAISTAELRAFIAAAQLVRADGASIYDVATTDPAWWRDLAALRHLGR